ncbi:MAG: histidinol-phosphatase [Lentisphaeria bacterium]|nr:histidinol-phosphatase [Lentisphaeria bacterium]
MMTLNYPGLGIDYSLHTHTTWSDGLSSLEELCRQGKKMGLKVLGVSDHYYIHPNMPKRTRYTAEEYVADALKMRERYEDENFSLKIGLEMDFFFENTEEVLKDLEQYPFDYIIGSVHYVGTFPIDHDPSYWVDLTEERKEEICAEYWRKMEAAAACEKFTFLGHLDLPKKFGLIDNSRYFSHALRVLDILAQRQGALELNTAGWFKPCAESYPSCSILEEAYKRHIPVVISADAHQPEHLMRHFTEARELLNSVGYKL